MKGKGKTFVNVPAQCKNTQAPGCIIIKELKVEEPDYFSWIFGIMYEVNAGYTRKETGIYNHR